jgi:alpha-galactosidase
LGEKPQEVSYSWKDLEVPDGSHAVRDVWARKDLGSTTSLQTHLAPHAAMLYRVE